MGLKLTVLGCDGSYPGPGGATSGYLVEGDGTRIWLDAGSGTLANLQRHVGLRDIDAIVLSHAHPDHWSDIEGYYVAVTYGEEKREGVPVYAPSEVRAKVSTDMEPSFAWHDVSDGSRVEVGSLGLTFSRTDHGPVTLAVRVDCDGKALGYSADSGPAWSLEALGPGLDLALCEASFLQDREGSVQHLSARQAGTTARAAAARRLVVTHTWPTVDRNEIKAEAEAAFGGPVEVAAVDAVFEVA